MVRRSFFLTAWATLVLLIPFGATAQSPADPVSIADDTPVEPPAHLSLVDGVATLERDGRAQQAAPNMPLFEGDRLRTDRGRVEVVFPDGSYLHLDQFTTADLLSGALVRVMTGRVILGAAGTRQTRPDFEFQVDTPAGSARVFTPGHYRVSMYSGPEVELAVVHGEASLATSQGSTPVGAGQRAFSREGAAPSAPEPFNSARYDAFEQWSDEQRSAELGDESARYLPSELDTYSYVFDRYGQWRDVEPYGSVWYPTVSVGWRPYYNGWWDSYSNWGWFWIGGDPWAWPTHHYGRWGFDGGWYWIPQRRFGAAWVSWALSPGYMGWCPLGWHNRPVIGIHLDNAYYGGRYMDPWNAWTVVPRGHFGNGVRVSSVAVRGSGLDVAVRRGMVEQTVAPQALGRAVPRMSRPIGPMGAGASGVSSPQRLGTSGGEASRAPDGLRNRGAVPRNDATGAMDRSLRAQPRSGIGRDSASPAESSGRGLSSARPRAGSAEGGGNIGTSRGYVRGADGIYRNAVRSAPGSTARPESTGPGAERGLSSVDRREASPGGASRRYPTESDSLRNAPQASPRRDSLDWRRPSAQSPTLRSDDSAGAWRGRTPSSDARPPTSQSQPGYQRSVPRYEAPSRPSSPSYSRPSAPSGPPARFSAPAQPRGGGGGGGSVSRPRGGTGGSPRPSAGGGRPRGKG